MSDLELLLRNIVSSWPQSSSPEVGGISLCRHYFSPVKVVRAGKLVIEAVSSSRQHDEWEDKKGYKCSPAHLPLLPGPHLDVLHQVRKVNDFLSWKIPLQVVDGDANK